MKKFYVPPHFSKEERLKRIGENLLIYREAAGKAIPSVANSLGLDAEYIERVERGKAELTFVQYVAVSELYGVGFSSIFEAKNEVYFLTPKVPAPLVKYIVAQLFDYCSKNGMTRHRLYEVLGTSSACISNFGRYQNTPMPPTMENIIGLLGLKSDDLKRVSCEIEPEKPKPLNERQKDIDNIHNQILIEEFHKKKDEPNSVLDAMTLVTEALSYYRNKDKITKVLKKIAADIQELLQEMGDEE